MTQVWVIARHELRMASKDTGILAITLLFTLLACYGVRNGIAWARFQSAAVQEGTRLAEKRLSEFQREAEAFEIGAWKNASRPYGIRPWVVGGYGQFLGMPPGPLAALAIGQSDVYPYYTSVSVWPSERSMHNPYELENPTTLAAGRFDLAFVVVYLYPLLILSLSYNLLSIEREQGTLQLLAAQGIRVWDIVLGKIIVRGALALLPAVLAILIATAFPSGTMSLATVLRLAACLVLVLVYGAFWFSLAIAVNAAGYSSSASAAVLASCWVALAVVVPAVLNLVMTSYWPAPSRFAAIIEARQAASDAEQRGSKLLEEYYVQHPDLVSQGSRPNLRDFAATTYVEELEVDRRTSSTVRQFEAHIEAQRSLLSFLQFLSPVIIAQEATQELAGTGLSRYRCFRASTSAFKERWHAFFMGREFRKANLRSAEYSEIPRYTFSEPPISSVVSRAGTGCAGLGIFGAVLTLLGSRRIAHLRVTS